MGQVIQAGVGQAPARQAALERRPARHHQRDHDQPRLWPRPEVDHARGRRDPGGRRRGRRRGRHGKHEHGAVPARQGALRLPTGRRRDPRRDGPRRPLVLHRRLPHGHARRARRDQGARQPRRPGRVRPGKSTRRRSPRWTPAASTPSWCRSTTTDAKGRPTDDHAGREPPPRHQPRRPREAPAGLPAARSASTRTRRSSATRR